MSWRIRSGLLGMLLGLSLFFTAVAQEMDSVEDLKRLVMQTYRLETGRRSAYSSYLSPFSYKGTDVAFSGLWTKVMPQNPAHLAMHFDTRINFGNLLNPARTARELDFHLMFQWGMMWQKRLPDNWLIGAGGTAGAYGGLLYLPRNGNNPVEAQFAVGIGAEAFVSRLFRIKKLPILISDRFTFPLMSGFFCQQYGESYYEIYLGNRKGLAHFGWPGNRVGVDNLLSATLDLGRAALEVGYRFSMQNEHANNLTTRFYNHAFVIGIIPGGLGIKSNRKDIITPLY